VKFPGNGSREILNLYRSWAHSAVRIPTLIRLYSSEIGLRLHGAGTVSRAFSKPKEAFT
jgi:hypothetical protein